jgi:hypothetical protein
MRDEVFNACSLGAVLYNVPHHPPCSAPSQVLRARQTQRNTWPSLTPADASHNRWRS